ncbi:MAG TPA: hypothetical protein VF407_01710 [Polyangiaceae bacterium]
MIRSSKAFLAVVATTASALVALAGASCSSSSDSGAPTADASGGDAVRVVVDSASADTCTPNLPSGWTPPAFVPPRVLSICTTSQVSNIYSKCVSDQTATIQDCGQYSSQPPNLPCLACMSGDSESTTYGPVINLSNSGHDVNLGGCVALVDNDLGGTGCAGKVEAAQQCEWAACTGGCPIDIDDPTLRAKSAAAFADCVAAAKTGACATYVSAAACADDAKYASCMFTDETQTVSAYGTLFCSAPDDGGTTADAGDGG